MIVLAGVLYVISKRGENDPNWVFLFILIFVGIGLWVYVEEVLKIQKRYRDIEFLKNKNRVSSISVKSEKCWELPEEGDEGIYYLFELENHTTVLIGGQEFYSPRKFPNSHFEIVQGQGKKGNLVLEKIINYGQKLAPEKKVIGDKKWAILEKFLQHSPESSFPIIDAELESIEQSL